MNDSTKGYYFCKDTGQVVHDDEEGEENLFADFYTELLPALAANARAKGETIDEDYESNLDVIDLEDIYITYYLKAATLLLNVLERQRVSS
jgi:hypothetical protein